MIQTSPMSGVVGYAGFVLASISPINCNAHGTKSAINTFLCNQAVTSYITTKSTFSCTADSAANPLISNLIGVHALPSPCTHSVVFCHHATGTQGAEASVNKSSSTNCHISTRTIFARINN